MSGRLRRWVAWLLLAACAVLAGTALLVGEYTTPYGDLRHAISVGDVDEVTVTDGLPDGARGSATVEVRWRAALIGRVSEVVEARPRREARGLAADLLVVASVAEDLTAIDPDVTVHRGDRWGSHTDLFGWRLPVWTGLAALGVGLSVLLLIIGGPQPWRANRWAWFWFLWLAPPVGVVGYLLLGGPTGLLPPRDDAPRIRGGWGFIYAFVVSLVGAGIVTLVLSAL